MESLEYFHEEEIDILFRGTQEQWSVEKLNECVCFGHGYSRQSMQAQWLLEVLAEMDGHQQRLFLQFLTGESSSQSFLYFMQGFLQLPFSYG